MAWLLLLLPWLLLLQLSISLLSTLVLKLASFINRALDIFALKGLECWLAANSALLWCRILSSNQILWIRVFKSSFEFFRVLLMKTAQDEGRRLRIRAMKKRLEIFMLFSSSWALRLIYSSSWNFIGSDSTNLKLSNWVAGSCLLLVYIFQLVYPRSSWQIVLW